MNKISFLHGRTGDRLGNLSSFGGMTIALRGEADGTTTVAVARCMKQDRYVKSIGRQKAAGRLNATCEVTRKKFVRVLPISVDQAINAFTTLGIDPDELLGRDRFVRE